MLIGARIRSEEGVDAPPLLITFCVLPMVPTNLARGHWTLHALPMSTDLSELAVMQRGNTPPSKIATSACTVPTSATTGSRTSSMMIVLSFPSAMNFSCPSLVDDLVMPHTQQTGDALGRVTPTTSNNDSYNNLEVIGITTRAPIEILVDERGGLHASTVVEEGFL